MNPSNAAAYYQPYRSDDETELSEEISDLESDVSEYEDPRVRREQDPRYAIIRRPGPQLQTTARQLEYAKGPLAGAPWDSTGVPNSLKDYTYTQPPKTTKTTLICLRSINRDVQAYPTPWNLELKLPRVYKNVKKFQLAQFSFPDNATTGTLADLYTSSLVQIITDWGVPADCLDTCIGVITCSPDNYSFGLMEQGRTNNQNMPLMTALSLPPNANYSNQQLADELTFQANKTPPLNLISYETFHDIFTNTRDISILFNEPGDQYGSNASNIRLQRHTKQDIMNTYYTQDAIDRLPVITDRAAFVAYYFPILKEAVATGRAKPFLRSSGIPYQQIHKRVMGPFEGLDSDFYYTICSLNRTALENFRPHLTFELRNVNQYKWYYNRQEKRMNAIHDRLHASLQREFDIQRDSIMEDELILRGLHVNSFQSLKTDSMHYSCIYKHLDKNLSTVMSNYCVATGYQYSGGSTYSIADSTLYVSDLQADEHFTTMFQYKSTIGRLYGNYSGVPMQFTSFMDYHSTLSSYYDIYHSTQNVISSVYGTVNSRFHSYVSTKYTGVLPAQMISTQTYASYQALPVSFVTTGKVYVSGILPSMIDPDYLSTCYSTCVLSTMEIIDSTCEGKSTDPYIISACISTASQGVETYCSTSCYCTPICCEILTQIMIKWYGCLPTNLVVNTLTYKLGLLEIPPETFNLVSTVMDLTSTGRLNYLLQMNEEQGFNNIDIAMAENRAVTNEGTGQVRLVYAKIMNDGVQSAATVQTVFQNPIVFENTLGKLDHLTFSFYFDDQTISPVWQFTPFQIYTNEWNCIVQIDEEVGVVNQLSDWKDEPSIPIPEDPNNTPYLYYKKK